MTDPSSGSNDPGTDAAGARAADVESAAATPIEVGGGGHIRIGTASWTDPTMTATGVFYATAATTAEERLQHYASTFPLVEVDATYYALPSAATAKLWVERTPPDFVFDIKAHALMTGQGTETKRLPKALRAARWTFPADETMDAGEEVVVAATGAGLGELLHLAANRADASSGSAAAAPAG